VGFGKAERFEAPHDIEPSSMKRAGRIKPHCPSKSDRTLWQSKDVETADRFSSHRSVSAGSALCNFSVFQSPAAPRSCRLCGEMHPLRHELISGRSCKVRKLFCHEDRARLLGRIATRCFDSILRYTSQDDIKPLLHKRGEPLSAARVYWRCFVDAGSVKIRPSMTHTSECLQIRLHATWARAGIR